MAKKKILIIDDAKDFTCLVKKNLEKTRKYKVKTESEGSQGLIAARKFKPDLILLDVLMPGMNGGSVCSLLEKDADTKNIPIVFLTAAVTMDETGSAIDTISGRPVIAKPVDMDDIIACIKENIIE